MRVKLIIANDPLFDVRVTKSGPIPVLASKVCDSHKAFVLRTAAESYDILVFRIQNFEVAIYEHVFMFSPELQTTLPVRENRFTIRNLSCSIDVGIVVIDSHPWLDVRLAETSIGCRVPLHWRPSMVASLQLEQFACIVQLAMVVSILRLSTARSVNS